PDCLFRRQSQSTDALGSYFYSRMPDESDFPRNCGLRIVVLRYHHRRSERWCLSPSHLAMLFLSAFLLLPFAFAQTKASRSSAIPHHTHRYHAKRLGIPYGARIGAVCRDGVVTSE